MDRSWRANGPAVIAPNTQRVRFCSLPDDERARTASGERGADGRVHHRSRARSMASSSVDPARIAETIKRARSSVSCDQTAPEFEIMGRERSFRASHRYNISRVTPQALTRSEVVICSSRLAVMK